ncbi:MAG: hypothetical protein ACI8TQ_001350 [Planctomycetota bacterium]|jgi:hypothetical protein
MKSLLITAAALALFAPDAVLLESKHTEGEVRRTTVQYEKVTSLVEMTASQNGQEMPPMEGMEQEQSVSRTGSFVDKALKVEEGDLLVFEREYVEFQESHSMSMSGPMGSQSNDGETESELNGKRVHFEVEDGEFVASYPEDQDGDDEWLEGLDAELPWAQFLGTGDLNVGDEWEVEPRLVWRALNPGGQLSFTDENGQTGQPTIDIDEIEFDGAVKAKLVAIEDVDGAPHAQISITLEFVAISDLTELMANQEAPEDAPAGMPMPDIDSMIFESDYTGEASLSWSIGTGAMQSFELTYEIEETQIMELSFEMGPETMSIEQMMTFEGEGSLTVSQEEGRE